MSAILFFTACFLGAEAFESVDEGEIVCIDAAGALKVQGGTCVQDESCGMRDYQLSCDATVEGPVLTVTTVETWREVSSMGDCPLICGIAQQACPIDGALEGVSEVQYGSTTEPVGSLPACGT